MLILLILFGAVVGCEPPPTGTGNGGVIDSTIATGAKLLWHVPRLGNSSVQTQPVRSGDSLFVVDEHSFRCLNALTGETIWNSSPQEQMGVGSAENVIFDGQRMMNIDDYQITCASLTTGALLWTLPRQTFEEIGFQSSYFNSFAQSGDAIFVASRIKGYLYKINKSNGAIVWKSGGALLEDSVYIKANASWNGCPTYYNGRVYISGRYGRSVFKGMNHDGSVACFDAESGKQLWITRIPAMDMKYSPYATYDTILPEFWTNEAPTDIIAAGGNVMVKTGNSVTWLDPDGNILWRSGDPDKHALTLGSDQLRYWQNRLLVLDYKNGMSKCYGVDPLSHEFLWTTLMSENNTNYRSFVLCPPPAYVGTVAYFLSDDYWVIGIDVITGKRTYALNLAAAVEDFSIPSQTMDGGFLIDKDHHIYIMDNVNIYCLEMTK
jgi:outer membrane protein assembly factor BamB